MINLNQFALLLLSILYNCPVVPQEETPHTTLIQRLSFRQINLGSLYERFHKFICSKLEREPNSILRMRNRCIFLASIISLYVFIPGNLIYNDFTLEYLGRTYGHWRVHYLIDIWSTMLAPIILLWCYIYRAGSSLANPNHASIVIFLVLTGSTEMFIFLTTLLIPFHLWVVSHFLTKRVKKKNKVRTRDSFDGVLQCEVIERCSYEEDRTNSIVEYKPHFVLQAEILGVSEDHIEWAMHIGESLMLFANHISHSRTVVDYSCSVLSLIKMITPGSLLMSVLKNDYIRELLTEIETSETPDDDTHNVQGIDGITSQAREFLNITGNFKQNALYKKLYKVIMYSLSFSVLSRFGITFDTFGYTIFEAEAIKKKFNSASSFAFALSDSFVFLLEKGVQIIKTGEISAIVHNSANYTKFATDVLEIKRKALYLNNPEAVGFDEHSFFAELKRLIEVGKNIQRYDCEMNAVEKRIHNQMLNDLAMLEATIFMKDSCREPRQAPFSILISGDSGIGKSTLVMYLFHHFCKIMKLCSEPKFYYAKNPTAKYWDGFSTMCHTIIMDDIAFMSPNYAPNGDPTVMEFLQVINSIPYVPDQADLSDKGRTPLRAKFVIGTTNTENLKAAAYFSHPSAVQRRFPFIVEPSVKKEFCKNGELTLDPNKISIEEGKFINVWNFKVKKVSPTPIKGSNTKQAKVEVIHNFEDIYDFMRWFQLAVEKFQHEQEKVKFSMSSLAAISACDSCHLPECRCETQGVMSIFLYLKEFMIMNFYFNMVQFTLALAYFLTGWIIFDKILCRLEAFIKIRAYQLWVKNLIRVYSEFGKKVGRIASSPQFAIVATALSATLAYMVFCKKQNAKAAEIQSETISAGRQPKPRENERPDVWYQSEFKLSSFELSRPSLSSHGMTPKAFFKLISKNLISFKIRKSHDLDLRGRLSCLKGFFYITNNHLIPPCSQGIRMELISGDSLNGVNDNVRTYITEADLLRMPEKDLVIIRLQCMPPRKGIAQYLPESDIDIKHNGWYVKRGNSGELLADFMGPITKQRDLDLPKLNIKTDVLVSQPDKLTKDGDCGTLAVIQTPKGYVIYGLHIILTGQGSCLATCVTQSDLSSVLENFMHLEPGKPDMEAPTAKVQLGDLHFKSTFRYIEDGSANVYGSLSGFRTSGNSKVENTPMSEFLKSDGYKIKYTKPIMKGWEPWRIAAKDLVDIPIKINTNLLQHCKRAYIKDIIGSICACDLADLFVLDDFTTVNGAPGVRSIDKIKRNTSAGFPWRKSKKFFLKLVPPIHGMQDPVEVSPEILDRSNDIIQTYMKGIRAHPVFTAHLKDEAVTFSKAERKKTRVFTGAPFDWSLVVRKFYLSFVRVLQNNRLAFEAAVGTTAQSREWDGLYHYVTQQSPDHIVAGDFSAFDKRMPPVFILAAFEIIIEVCALSGNFNECDMKIMWGIAVDTAYPTVDFNGDLVEFYGSNPSGHPLTVIINSLVNSLYMRYVFGALSPGIKVEDFRRYVSLLTYGDDNIMSVSPSIPWFNHTSIAEAFADIGIKYTMADKDSESVPYIHISQASFLKRAWVYNNEIEAHLAPLDHDSIEKSLMVWVKSTTIGKEQQCIAIINSAVREYFQYGREEFEYRRKLLKKLVGKMNLWPWVEESTFPKWKYLVNEYEDASEKLAHCAHDRTMCNLQSDFSVLKCIQRD